MLKFIIPVVVVLILGVGGFFLYQNFQTAKVSQPTSTPQIATTPQPTIEPTSSPVTTADSCEVLTKGSADVPPLYSGIQWQQPKMTEYEVPLGEQGSKKMQGCLVKSQTIQSSISLMIFDYYNLKKFGWQNLVSASGPNGSADSFQKEKTYFLIREVFLADSGNTMIDLFYSQ